MKNPTNETQGDLETLFSRHQLLPVLKDQFAEICDNDPFTCELLAQIYLHRQADPVTMVGILSPKYGNPQEVADKIALACEYDFLDFDMNTEKLMVKYDVTDDVKAMLERYQYPLPMVVKPQQVKTNLDTGYLSIKNLVVLNGSDYFLDKDMCLDHLNRSNSVALALDFRVVSSDEGKLITPVRKNGEDFEDFQKRKRQANIFYETSLEVMEGLTTFSDVLYLTHKYDRRGRCYVSGYHVNSQGTDYNKAVLQLAKKEVIDP